MQRNTGRQAAYEDLLRMYFDFKEQYALSDRFDLIADRMVGFILILSSVTGSYLLLGYLARLVAHQSLSTVVLVRYISWSLAVVMFSFVLSATGLLVMRVALPIKQSKLMKLANWALLLFAGSAIFGLVGVIPIALFCQ